MNRRSVLGAALTCSLLVVAGAASAKDWKTVVIGMEGAYEPYNLTDPSGKIVGFEPDLAMDVCARALLAAAALIEDGAFDRFTAERYAGWDGAFGKDILDGKLSLEQIAAQAADAPAPKPKSGRQEYLENLVNRFV